MRTFIILSLSPSTLVFIQLSFNFTTKLQFVLFKLKSGHEFPLKNFSEKRMVALCGGFSFFSCISDPARRSSFFLKLALVMLHLTYVAVLFGFDKELIHKTKQSPWYTAVYLLLLVASLAQYFITSGSSPGWYICSETALSLWTGTLYIQYLKSHVSKPWWSYAIVILLLAALSICLFFLLLLLLFHCYLILTNQTTYELVRRRRIPYLRNIPQRAFPFSKGVCRNLYEFCCAWSSMYRMEPLPTAQELEEKSRPYTCSDVLSCRCCC